MFVETHAHLHFETYADDIEAVMERAAAARVGQLITVGVDAADSRKAVDFAAAHHNVWAAAGIHPHVAAEGEGKIAEIRALLDEPKVVAVGECGLDYVKASSSKKEQENVLRAQIELAGEKDLPLILHVREGFDDFFRILDGYSDIRGVVHCFTENRKTMEKVVERGLSIALNGIMTFTKDLGQLDAAAALPHDRLLLETDCPYLAPASVRGQRNEPSNIPEIAKFLAQLRDEPVDQIASATSQNARVLFGLPSDE